MVLEYRPGRRAIRVAVLASRAAPSALDYLRGLLSPVERKNGL